MIPEIGNKLGGPYKCYYNHPSVSTGGYHIVQMFSSLHKMVQYLHVTYMHRLMHSKLSLDYL